LPKPKGVRGLLVGYTPRSIVIAAPHVFFALTELETRPAAPFIGDCPYHPSKFLLRRGILM
jgi:hypothetical protein